MMRKPRLCPIKGVRRTIPNNMATLEQRPTLKLDINFRLSEQEAGALDALAGYGFDPFIKVFYEKMGEAYMKPYEAGLKSLFESVRDQLPSILARAEKARKAFNT